MSLFQSLGLSLGVFRPLVQGGNFLFSLTGKVSSYQHTISAYGGFDTATLALNGKGLDIEDWYENGLGRHLEITSEDLGIVWEGFVDEVDVNDGKLSATIGPLVDLGNRCLVKYSQIDTSTNPPTTIGTALTTLVQDTTSQGLYGIWEKQLSGGTVTSTDAGYERDTYIAEQAYPARAHSLTSGATQPPSVTLKLRGYFYWLTAYPYSQTTTSGTMSATARIQAVLTANPNSVLSSDYTHLATNALLVPQYENDGTYADGAIKSVVSLGDASAGRWTFGIYEHRIAYYQAGPAILAYQQSVRGNDRGVYTLSGSLVRPWAVRPAQWLFMKDFLVGKTQTTPLKTDPRNLFIEQVSFTAPYDLSLMGGKSSQLAQVLAQLSMGGLF